MSWRQYLAEFIGTALLVIAIIGSGIAAQRLSPSDAGLELLENAIATGAALVAIILAIGPISGAHLNPVISLADAAFGGLRWRVVPGYAASQLLGGALGAIAANLMFDLPAVSLSAHGRTGSGLWLAEAMATFGLLLTVFGVARSGRTSAAPFAVGAYVTAAYWFTSSTSFANPAVTLARTLSNTFAGIAPASVGAFLLAQIAGGLLALATLRALGQPRERGSQLVLPHGAAA